MLKNYFKIGCNNLKQNKSYPIITIAAIVLCLGGLDLAHGQDTYGQNVDALLYGLCQEHPGNPRWAETMVLRVVRNKGLAPLIEALKTDKNHAVRAAAAKALGIAGDESGIETLRAIKPLAAALQTDEHFSVRRAAAKALGNIGAERATGVLIEALQTGENPSVRVAATLALGRIDDERAIDPLIEALLNADHADVRVAAADALGLIGKEAAIEPLKEAMQQDVPKVRRAAAEVIELIWDNRYLITLLRSHIYSSRALRSLVRRRSFVGQAYNC